VKTSHTIFTYLSYPLKIPSSSYPFIPPCPEHVTLLSISNLPSIQIVKLYLRQAGYPITISATCPALGEISLNLIMEYFPLEN
jgi:hypothetical protein